jgi:hypothetical protein
MNRESYGSPARPFVFTRRHCHGVIDGLSSTCYPKAFISIRGSRLVPHTTQVEALKIWSTRSFVLEQLKISEQSPSDSYLHSPLSRHID